MKIGFVLSTKDRTNYTRRCLDSLNRESGFGIVWVDGSETTAGRRLLDADDWGRVHFIAKFRGVGGGSAGALTFGLKYLWRSGYDLIGNIENDMEFSPGWFDDLMALFDAGKAVGLNVGAVTSMTLDSRVLMYNPDPPFALLWNLGASTFLATRPAVEAILNNFREITAREVYEFFSVRFGVDLRDRWELFMGANDRPLWMDWRFALSLYRNGMACLGSVPSMAVNMDIDVRRDLRTFYAGERAVGGIVLKYARQQCPDKRNWKNG